MAISKRKTNRLKPVLLFFGRSRGPLLRGQPRTVIEVPRRQSAGRCCPREVVAEIEEVVEEVYEGEIEEGVEPVHEIESAGAAALRSRSVPDGSSLRFTFMAAPKLFAAHRKPRI